MTCRDVDDRRCNSSACVGNGLEISAAQVCQLKQQLQKQAESTGRGPVVALTAPPRHWCVAETELRRIGRAVFVEVDLDAIANNLRLLKDVCRNKNVGVVGVVKGNAYGHGSVPVARHLISTGTVDRLAVANVAEAIQLRRAGICGIIHILGNVQSWEMPQCVRYRLTPTVASLSAVKGMAAALADSAAAAASPTRRSCSVSYCALAADHSDNRCESPQRTKTADGAVRRHCCAPVGSLHVKVDTGMSRNGCQPSELPTLIEACKVLGVPLEGIFSHISNHEDPNYSRYQLDNFLQCINPYRNDGYIFHIANSGAVLYDIGTDLDLIRPGISAFGMPSGPDLQAFVDMGFRPALSVRGTPTLVKFCSAGTKVGYACTYTCPRDEWIGTFPLGYADGVWRTLGEQGTHIIRDRTGERCPVVGRISMDAITVRLPCRPDLGELFTIVTADFDPVTSVTGISETVGTIQNEILIRFGSRLPRVYRTSTGAIRGVLGALELPPDDDEDGTDSDEDDGESSATDHRCGLETNGCS